jgi:hypothetical protein
MEMEQYGTFYLNKVGVLECLSNYLNMNINI